jgi:hypothetical protein
MPCKEEQGAGDKSGIVTAKQTYNVTPIGAVAYCAAAFGVGESRACLSQAALCNP